MIPFGFGPGTATLFAAALFCAAFVRGYSGFGFSAIFIAFAALFTDPRPLIPAVFLCEILMTAVQARGIAGRIDWRRVAALGLGAAVAVPASVVVIASVSEAAARLAVSGLILGLGLVLLSGWRLARPIGALGHAGVGIASGLANGAGVGGLPAAALLAAQPVEPAVFRATMVAYLTLLDLMTLPVMAGVGLVTSETLIAAALALPFLTAGILLGGRRFLGASPQAFRRHAVILLVGLAALGLVRALTA